MGLRRVYQERMAQVHVTGDAGGEGEGDALAGVLEQLSPAELRAVSKFLTLLVPEDAPG